MNSEWQAFLEAQGAVIAPGGEVRFPDAPEAPECALVDLSHLGLIRISGEDANDFLQGQITADVRELRPDRSQLGALCSPKGRMLAEFRLFLRGGAVYLQLPAERLGPVLQRLSMFVLRSRVELEDASDALVRLGLAGDCAEEILPGAPTEPNGVAEVGGLTLVRLPGDRPRFEVIGPVQEMQGLWRRARLLAQPADADLWRLLEIRAGLPRVYATTAEAFVPQMANLQLVGGVSFTKGCYTGQEVVARMQYLGKLKRRMYRVRLQCETRPEPGEPLYAPGSASGQGAGRLVEVAPSPEGGYEALAVIEIASAEAGELHLGDAEGPEVAFAPLPYAYEAAEAAPE